MPFISEATPIQKIEDDLLQSFGINLFVKRLDLNHPHISGNKWYKLKYNIEKIKLENHDTVLTFGGAYSNHIAAVAAAGKEFGFKTIGVIRGDEKKELNATLKIAVENGMRPHFISREAYRNKEQQFFVEQLKKHFGDFYLLPEGGSNTLAIKGCSEILNNTDIAFDHVCCSCGTGATLSGIIRSLKQNQNAIGFASLKGADFLEQNVKGWVGDAYNNWSINHDYHFGRYAKTTAELLKFIEIFENNHQIPLDPIYTGKMMFGIYDLVKKGFFVKCETILAIHTGGLQGKL